MKKVLVAMSGGVDSSVTAALLQEQGYEVAGITMRVLANYDKNDPAVDGAIVAGMLGIKHHIIDAVDFFDTTVMKYFINDYLRGYTPNPCTFCNKVLKFGLLFDKADELGYDFFATGHYATIKDGVLYRGIDAQKDQSYFLFPVYTRDARRILFPLGGMNKQQVRERGELIGLHNARKKDSQDICFIPGGDYTEFLKHKCGDRFSPGPILDINGKKIGMHSGIHNFTIGQRKGLGALGQPMYVKEIQPWNNAVVAAKDDELMSSNINVADFITGLEPLELSKTYSVQVRYRSKAVPCCIDSINGSNVRITFSEPVRAIAPGQYAVIYDNDRVIGGGVIC